MGSCWNCSRMGGFRLYRLGLRAGSFSAVDSYGFAWSVRCRLRTHGPLVAGPSPGRPTSEPIFQDQFFELIGNSSFMRRSVAASPRGLRFKAAERYARYDSGVERCRRTMTS